MVAAILIKGIPKLAKKGWKTLTVDKAAARLAEINKKLKKTPSKAKILKSNEINKSTPLNG